MTRSLVPKFLYFALAFLVLYYSPVKAQTIPDDQPFVFKVNRSQVLAHGNVAVLLTWIDGQGGKCWLLFKVNADKEAYYVARSSPQGTISFGYSREFIASMTQMGAVLANEGVKDFAKPFVMREDGRRTAIFQEEEQAVSDLFYTLNQFYVTSVGPSMEGRPQDFQGLAKVSLRQPLTREYPLTWIWGKGRPSFLIA